MLYLKQKQQLLITADSIYALFLKNAKLRFEKGESNILEKTTAESQRGQILRQTEMVNADLSETLVRFRIFLNTVADLEPASDNFRLPLPVIVDTSLSAHPQLQYLNQQQQVSKAQTQVEKAKLLPDLNFGYYNQSFRGTQDVNGNSRFYTGSDRFSSVQVGIAVPIFGGAQRNRVSAARIQEQKAQVDYQAGVQEFQSRYRQAAAELDKYRRLADYDGHINLPNAKTILNTAHQQFIAGQINYLEYTLLINQAMTLRNDYIEAVNSLNQTIIHINALQNK